MKNIDAFHSRLVFVTVFYVLCCGARTDRDHTCAFSFFFYLQCFNFRVVIDIDEVMCCVPSSQVDKCLML